MTGIITRSTIDSDTALRLAKAGRDYAIAQGWKTAIAVVDQAGDLLAFSRVDGAPAACGAIAQDKAFTAVSFSTGTREMAENLAHEAPRVLDGLTAYERLAFFGGGMPVIIDGQTVGAVGISGSSEAGDEACAISAIDTVFGNRKTDI